MVAIRVIPCLDVNAGRVVKGTNFVDLRDAGNPVEIAKMYNIEGADELIFLDITASSDKRAITLDVVKKTAEQVFIPLTVGGGIRTVEDMRTLLKAGADKISINTSAVLNPNLIHDGSRKFGNQCIVVAIDAKKDGDSWVVYTHGGRIKTNLNVIKWVQQCVELGAGEILLTSMDKDGTKDGYDLKLVEEVTKVVTVPVIASGGAGKKEHFVDVCKAGASAVLAASLFHFKQLKISDLKQYMKQNNIEVR